jgi:hypothetical protein
MGFGWAIVFLMGDRAFGMVGRSSFCVGVVGE